MRTIIPEYIKELYNKIEPYMEYREEYGNVLREDAPQDVIEARRIINEWNNMHGDRDEDKFYQAMMNHEEPPCPKCGKGRIVCPQGKIDKPHFFTCTNNCGWFIHFDPVVIIE